MRIDFAIEDTDIVTFPEDMFLRAIEVLLFVNADDVEMAQLSRALVPVRSLMGDFANRSGSDGMYGVMRAGPGRRKRDNLRVSVRLMAGNQQSALALAQRLNAIMNTRQQFVDLSPKGTVNGSRPLTLVRSPRIYDEDGGEVCNDIDLKCGGAPNSGPSVIAGYLLLTVPELIGVVVAIAVPCFGCTCCLILWRCRRHSKSDTPPEVPKQPNDDDDDEINQSTPTCSNLCNVCGMCCGTCMGSSKVTRAVYHA
jgi:hypothetical protein